MYPKNIPSVSADLDYSANGTHSERVDPDYNGPRGPLTEFNAVYTSIMASNHLAEEQLLWRIPWEQGAFYQEAKNRPNFSDTLKTPV